MYICAILKAYFDIKVLSRIFLSHTNARERERNEKLQRYIYELLL